MESVLDFPELAIPETVAHAECANESNWTIAMSVSVDADKRRIFQALTAPEYLEAWVAMPERIAGSRLVATQGVNGYRLDLYSAGHRAVSIMGSFLSCHQRKMRLFWRKTCLQTHTRSLVDFRLRGNFGGSILELRHTALDSAEEFLWYQELWQGSLAKLSSLMRPA